MGGGFDSGGFGGPAVVAAAAPSSLLIIPSRLLPLLRLLSFLVRRVATGGPGVRSGGVCFRLVTGHTRYCLYARITFQSLYCRSSRYIAQSRVLEVVGR